MFYCVTNFKTKKDLKAAVSEGKQVTIYAPGLGNPPENGTTAVGGPHYPKPHTWYAEVTLVNGVVTKVR